MINNGKFKWKLFLVLLVLAISLFSVLVVATESSRSGGAGAAASSSSVDSSGSLSTVSSNLRSCRDSRTCSEIDEVWGTLLPLIKNVVSTDKYWFSEEGSDLEKGSWVSYDTKYPTAALEGEDEVETGEIVLPVTNPRITSCFGDRTLNSGLDCHDGIDFGGNVGDDVYTIADGVVEDFVNICTDNGNTGCGSGWGNWVLISHKTESGEEFLTRYSHLDSVEDFIKKDEFIAIGAGEKIGELGNTGHSTAKHLHLSVYKKGQIGGSDPGINPYCLYNAYGIDLNELTVGKNCSSWEVSCNDNWIESPKARNFCSN